MGSTRTRAEAADPMLDDARRMRRRGTGAGVGDSAALTRLGQSFAAKARSALAWTMEQVGGPARFRVVAVLAGVQALDGADKGTVAATASNLEQAFGIHNTEIGLLVTASTLVGAALTVPVGALVDRISRTRLLGGSIAVWGIAMLFGGASQSYLWLILSRIALGAVTATAGPAVASLTGDFFPGKDRARMYGFILGGELVGTGVGFVVSGLITSLFGWRYAFWWLMIPSGFLAVLMWRLAEPSRGGQSRIKPGEEEIRDAADFADADRAQIAEAEEAAMLEERDGVAAQVAESDYEPYENQILTEDPARKGLWWAIKYVLRVRTDVVIIIASALGYFYFSGLRTFAIIFAQGQYGISKPVASSLTLVVGAGALVGVLAGGQFADWLRERGVINARVIVPAAVLFAISLFLGPAFWTTELWIALPLLTVGAALLGAANPPQDAARLDIIHPHLWGRSEGVRSALRGLLDAAAPVTFGVVSDTLFGGKVKLGARQSGGSSQGLSYTFLLFLIILVIAGVFALIALRTYPRDVATADASVRNTLGTNKPKRD